MFQFGCNLAGFFFAEIAIGCKLPIAFQQMSYRCSNVLVKCSSQSSSQIATINYIYNIFYNQYKTKIYKQYYTKIRYTTDQISKRNTIQAQEHYKLGSTFNTTFR